MVLDVQILEITQLPKVLLFRQPAVRMLFTPWTKWTKVLHGSSWCVSIAKELLSTGWCGGCPDQSRTSKEGEGKGAIALPTLQSRRARGHRHQWSGPLLQDRTACDILCLMSKPQLHCSLELLERVLQDFLQSLANNEEHQETLTIHDTHSCIITYLYIIYNIYLLFMTIT